MIHRRRLDSRAASRLTIAFAVIAIVAVAGIVLVSEIGSSKAQTSPYPPGGSVPCGGSSPSSSSTTKTSSPSAAPSPSAQATTGVIVPLFTIDPSQRASESKQIVQLRLSHPTVPMLVVFDVDSGPKNYSSASASEIQGMRAVGVTVLGYVTTSWGERNVSAVEADMLKYHHWYEVNGIYLDEMPNWNYNGPNGSWYYKGPGGKFMPTFYSTLTAYGKSLGFTKMVANAGADVPQDFIGSVDTMGIFENAYLPSLSLTAGWYSIAGLNAWHTHYDKSNFMFFSYNVPRLDPSYVRAAANYVAYMYITSETEASGRYSTLSPYLDQLLSLLASQPASTECP